MKVLLLAWQEVRIGLRNRWVLATTLLLAALALALVLLGSAPTGDLKADPLEVVIVSLSSLTIFLLPLIALLLSFDAIVGEQERGTLLLLLAYPVARWQVVLGKALGQSAIIAVATLIGYGAAALALWLQGGVALQAWGAFGAMIGTSVLLGAAFVALGCLASTLVRERATAAGLAVAVWLLFVLLYDTALLGLLVADAGRHLDATTLNLALLLNPADAYRLYNLGATEGTAIYSGMAGPGAASGLPAWLLLAVLVGWVLAPLALAIAALRGRSV